MKPEPNDSPPRVFIVHMQVINHGQQGLINGATRSTRVQASPLSSIGGCELVPRLTGMLSHAMQNELSEKGNSIVHLLSEQLHQHLHVDRMGTELRAARPSVIPFRDRLVFCEGKYLSAHRSTF